MLDLFNFKLQLRKNLYLKKIKVKGLLLLDLLNLNSKYKKNIKNN